MTKLTREDVLSLAGPIDDLPIAKILATGATLEDVARAHAWLTSDDAMMNADEPLPAGKAAEVLDILAAIEDEDSGDPQEPH